MFEISVLFPNFALCIFFFKSVNVLQRVYYIKVLFFYFAV